MRSRHVLTPDERSAARDCGAAIVVALRSDLNRYFTNSAKRRCGERPARAGSVLRSTLVAMNKLLVTLGVTATLVLSLGSRAAAQNGPTDPYGGMEGRLFDAGGGFTLPYRLFRPVGYNAANKYPLVIFLHGSGESGTNNRLQI